MKVLAIIPARGGSKGVPRKNIIPILMDRMIASWRVVLVCYQQKVVNYRVCYPICRL